MKLLNRSFLKNSTLLTLFILISLTQFSCTPSNAEIRTESKKEAIANVPIESGIPQYSIGESAPDFELFDLQGNSVALSDMAGKFIVMHFATTWCPFCNAEAPYLEEINRKYKSKGVKVIIIDVKEEQAVVQEKLQDRFNFTFPILMDNDGKVAASYAPEGVLMELSRDEVVLASNLLIDRDGKIQFYSLLDSQNFDSELIALKAKLNELL